MKLYYGSNVEVKTPEIKTLGFYKDFGYGFIVGNITREAFWVLVKFKYPTHQIVFCTDSALQSLSYLNSYAL